MEAVVATSRAWYQVSTRTDQAVVDGAEVWQCWWLCGVVLVWELVVAVHLGFLHIAMVVRPLASLLLPNACG